MSDEATTPGDGPGPGGSAETHYSGVLVRTRPETVPGCAEAVDAIPGVEVHLRHPGSGRIIAVLESADLAGQETLMKRVREVPGVLAAALVYHVVDDGSEQVPS